MSGHHDFEVHRFHENVLNHNRGHVGLHKFLLDELALHDDYAGKNNYPIEKIPFITSDEATAKQIAIRQRLDGEVILGVSVADSRQWLSVAGGPLEALSAEGALFMAGLQTDLAADTADWVDVDVIGSEYRGRPLPLWRVFNSGDPSLVAYVDAYSGQVTAIRSNAWRWWDFLWALHIMDYDDRDDIGTVLLKIFSVLAVLTAIAGIALYFLIPRKKSA